MNISLKERLNKILIEKGLLTPEKLDEALEAQKKKGGKLSDILVEKGFIGRKDLMIILSEELGIPPINLSRYKVDPAVIKLVPRKLAQHYQLIPISKMGNLLTIAVADPLNILAVDEIKSLTGLQIGILITTDKDIQTAIDEYYGEATHEAIEEIMAGMERGENLEIVEEADRKDAASMTDLMRLTQETPVVKVANLILAEAVKMKASDVLIEPTEKALRVRYRIDGVLREAKNPPRSMHEAIVSRLKVMSSLNIAEHRLPQDGRFKIRIQNREVDFRVSILLRARGRRPLFEFLTRARRRWTWINWDLRKRL